MQLDVKSAIVCDLVRIEKTEKHILIGVYTGKIIGLTKPMLLRPTFWIEFISPVQNADFELDIKLEAPGLRKPQVGTVKGSIEQEKTTVLTFTAPYPLEITEAGVLKLSMRLKGGRWRTALAKEIEFAGSSSSPAI